MHFDWFLRSSEGPMCNDDVNSLFSYFLKQIDSMLPCICLVADQRHQNVVRTSVNDLAIALCAIFLCLLHLDLI